MQNKPPFISDSRGSASVSVKSGSKGGEIAPNRAQKMGGTGYNADSEPAGGAILKADPSGKAGNSGTVAGVGGVASKPYKVGEPKASKASASKPAKVSEPSTKSSAAAAGSLPED